MIATYRRRPRKRTATPTRFHLIAERYGLTLAEAELFIAIRTKFDRTSDAADFIIQTRKAAA